MDLTNMTPTERAAWHRSEADRIEAEERARRPALAAGQVWIYPRTKEPWIAAGLQPHLVSLWDGNLFAGPTEPLEYLGLAHDVLRVVPPDPPAPQFAPEPTGAELVGKDVHVRAGEGSQWSKKGKCLRYHPELGYLIEYPREGQGWWSEAKPYVEGVAP